MTAASLFLAWIGLLGGLALFTFGLNQTSDSIRALTSGVLRRRLSSVARTPLGAVGTGFLATLLAGSSSAITVITVGLVNTGLLSLRQAFDVILGASVGTTLTVQLISLNITTYAPLLLFAGVVWMLVERGRDAPRLAPMLLGLGFILYGMNRMVVSVHTLAGLSWVHQSLNVLNGLPLLAGALAFMATAVIQNSATIIALAMTFQIHHLATLPTGLEMVLGANLGSTAASVYTALLGGSRAAKRTALGYFLMKLAGAVVFTVGAKVFAHAVMAVDPSPARTLADAHSLFNLVLATAFLPLTPWLAGWLSRLLPDPKPVPITRLDPALLQRPSAALPQVHSEIGRMALIIDERLVEPLAPWLFQPRDDEERRLRQAEMEIDLLHDAITHYLVSLGRTQRLNEADRTRQIELFYLTNRLEHLSDSVIKVIDTRVKLSGRDFTWTPKLAGHVQELMHEIQIHCRALATAISTRDAEALRSVVQKNPELRQRETSVRLYILTHGPEFERRALAAILELSDDLGILAARIGEVGRAALGIV